MFLIFSFLSGPIMQPMVNIALKAARKAARIIEHASDDIHHLTVDTKSPSDFVTEIDRAAEAEIIAILSKAYPDHAIISEETGTVGDPDLAEYTWLIDPLDGTTNFINHIPHYAVSIACMKNNRVEHAVILDPIKQDEFTATRGEGARLNGRRIRVKSAFTKERALFATGIPFGECPEARMDQFQVIQKSLSLGSSGMRRLGAASLDLAYVAAGRFDAFWEANLQSWDIAAGILLVLEAGGLVADFEAGIDYFESGNIVAGSPKALKQVLQVINNSV